MERKIIKFYYIIYACRNFYVAQILVLFGHLIHQTLQKQQIWKQI